jgi:hypothetical protein
VFASPKEFSQQPSRPDSALRKVLRPATVRARIIGLHTFRHSFARLESELEDVHKIRSSDGEPKDVGKGR